MNLLTSSGEWTDEDKLQLESELINKNAQNLCLDPNPSVAREHFQRVNNRHKLFTYPVKRKLKKYTQAAVNRKRKMKEDVKDPNFALHHFLKSRKEDFLQERKAARDKVRIII